MVDLRTLDALPQGDAACKRREVRSAAAATVRG
jgi:hypothetical protein